MNRQLTSGSFGRVGFEGTTSSTVERLKIVIDAYIPENFVIEKAFVILMHYPMEVRWQGQSYGYGYARQVKLYREVNPNLIMVWNLGSEYIANDNSSLYEISDSNLGNNGWTPNMTDESTLDMIKTNDISSNLNVGSNRFAIQTSEPIPAYSEDYPTRINNWYLHTGEMCAILEVYGYTNSQTK